MLPVSYICIKIERLGLLFHIYSLFRDFQTDYLLARLVINTTLHNINLPDLFESRWQTNEPKTVMAIDFLCTMFYYKSYSIVVLMLILFSVNRELNLVFPRLLMR